jgi:hypothetical protein
MIGLIREPLPAPFSFAVGSRVRLPSREDYSPEQGTVVEVIGPWLVRVETNGRLLQVSTVGMVETNGTTP